MRYLESPDALTAAGYQGEVDGGAGFESYGEALWWTATVITTIGPEYWPRTLEGRTLAFLLFVYAFAIFGYITATIASYFVSQDVRRQERRGPTRESEMLQSEGNTEMAVLLQELSLLRSQLASLSGRTVIDELPTTRQDE
jgi:voltage-gated potassium channel